ncbi:MULTISPECIES: SDR family NAD(P)-dependent oxidoreductase [Halorubrum]|uniref:Short-chain alcohol dehydrogenase n=1 Tax=Halorubrum hochstenium ATCC 700873 TaxID=1227481 RepID=M0FAV7_9EURY|nr:MULTISPECIES: SDR family NAD(P)-dependent oxidoreductase [Halorubrum]ELZ57161.1 short-chain alcohol dehydrogenase [Halorubrum hochstenium ATCC 700873]
MAVVVTGASRGIGRATAVELAERDVVVDYRSDEGAAAETARRVRDAGGEAVTVRADVRESAAADRLIETAVDEFGSLDAVVNNAGIARPNRLEETTDEAWESVIDTNLSGAFRVTRAAAPHLRESGGDVVFLSSVGGTLGTVDAGYAASKAGLHGLTRALARELGPDGVQVNAVAPGPVETDLNEVILDHLESIEFRGHENVDTHLPEYACDPATVADSVRYLIENDHVHGEILDVDGGMRL